MQCLRHPTPIPAAQRCRGVAAMSRLDRSARLQQPDAAPAQWGSLGAYSENFAQLAAPLALNVQSQTWECVNSAQ